MIKNKKITKKRWRKENNSNQCKKWKVINLDSACSVLLLDLIDFKLYEILF